MNNLIVKLYADVTGGSGNYEIAVQKSITIDLNGHEISGSYDYGVFYLYKNESLDDALRRFKRQVNKAGTIQEAKKREFYLKKGLKRKLKSENARRKNRK